MEQTPTRLLPFGIYLKVRLVEAQVLYKDLALKLGYKHPISVTYLMQGKTKITPALALKLEELGIGEAEDLLIKQAQWHLHLERNPDLKHY